MSIVTFRLSEKLLHELDECAHSAHLARAEYIRKAIEDMNKKALSDERKKRLIAASLKTRKESMRVNAEFGEIEDDPTA